MTDKPKRRPPSKTCGARRTDGSGATCGHSSGWGTDHPGTGRCKFHGGSTPSGRQAARREIAEQAVRTYGLPVDVDPGEALLDEVRRTYGHVVWLLERVRATDPDALIWGQTEQLDKTATEFPGVDTTYGAKPHMWLELYRAERDHLRRVCVDALRAGVEERRIRLAEDQGRQLAEVVRAILTDLGHSLDDEQVRQVVRLRLVEGGAG